MLRGPNAVHQEAFLHAEPHIAQSGLEYIGLYSGVSNLYVINMCTHINHALLGVCQHQQHAATAGIER